MICITCCPCGNLDTKAYESEHGFQILCYRCGRKTKIHINPDDTIAEWEKMCEEYYDQEEKENDYE